MTEEKAVAVETDKIVFINAHFHEVLNNIGFQRCLEKEDLPITLKLKLLRLKKQITESPEFQAFEEAKVAMIRQAGIPDEEIASGKIQINDPRIRDQFLELLRANSDFKIKKVVIEEEELALLPLSVNEIESLMWIFDFKGV
jgi:hypothetical protein